MRIVFFASSLVSAYWNGAATSYLGLARELERRGHGVVIFVRDLPWYAEHRGLALRPYGRAVPYRSLGELRERHEEAVRNADLVVVGAHVPEGIAVGDWVLRTALGMTAFYDINTPVTLAQLEGGRCEYLAERQVPEYTLFLSFTGGSALARMEQEYGSPRARPLYCSLDPELFFPEPPSREQWDLGYLGKYSQARQPVLEQLLIQPARNWGGGRFVVAGPPYPESIAWPRNVEHVELASPVGHRRFYCAQRFTLGVTRDVMNAASYSPGRHVFEAAACGTPIIGDSGDGLGTVLTVGVEFLVARSAREVVEYVVDMDERERRAIGERARARVLREHTAARRAIELERFAGERPRARTASPTAPPLGRTALPSNA